MHFVITFGFLIPVTFNTNAENDKNKVYRKKVTKRPYKERTIVKDTFNNVQFKSNIISVEQALVEIHVEYELLPGYTFKFDCRCWETAAKIYTEIGDSCLRPILCPIQKNNIWVIFSVHHMVDLNEIQLQKLFNHTITYQIFSGKKKFCERAKKDKVKIFHVHAESINIPPNHFLEIYSSELNSLTKLEQKSITVKHETNGEFNIRSYVDVIPGVKIFLNIIVNFTLARSNTNFEYIVLLLDNRHQFKFWKMLKKKRFPSESIQLTFNTSTQIKKDLKTKKLKKRNEKEDVRQKMSLIAGNLFSDMGLITCYSRLSQIPNISSIFIYTQCDNILSDKNLRRKLNPISIKLDQMSNFPDYIVTQNGFDYIYAKIIFVNKIIITPYYIPAKTIYFEFIKCFLKEEFQAEELVSFLGTKLLTFQIIGIRRKNVAKSIISTSKKSLNESDMLEQENVLLGFESFDISDLLRGLWEVKLIGNLSEPNNMYCISINDANTENSLQNTPLTNDILIFYGTSIKIKVHLACDLKFVHYKILQHVHIYNRICLMLNDYNLANNILADVSSHNCSLFCNFQSLCEDNDLKVEEATKNILTGFAIDCCDKYYIFLEGLAKGYLQKIWEKVAKLEIENGYVYYNSTCVFLTRLYENFIPIGGFLKLKLSKPLEVQLQEYSLYIGETRKTQEANIIRTVGLIKLTSTMQSLSQRCLYPNSNALTTTLNEITKN